MRALSTFRNLTGGRLPPLTRTALLCGLGVFLLTLVVFRPGAGGVERASPLANGVRLVAPGDARTESVVLLDTSAVYFPGKSTMNGSGRTEVGQPEDAPFARPAPILQLDPGRPLAKESTLQVPRQPSVPPAEAIPFAEASPYTTFGAHGFKRTAVDPRVAFFEIYPLGGSVKPVLSGKITHFNDKKGSKNSFLTKNNPLNQFYEVILSVDSFGRAPLGGVVRSTGSRELDEAIARWASEEDWLRRIPPGAYRLIVGP